MREGEGGMCEGVTEELGVREEGKRMAYRASLVY